MNLSFYEIFEISTGLLLLWVGIYLVAKNPSSVISWIITFFLASIGFALATDPILLNSRSIFEYVFWQKATAWPLFLSPILFYHASIYNSRKKLSIAVLGFGYLLAIIFYAMELHGDLILRETILRLPDYTRFDGFAPGVFLIPSVGTACFFAALGTVNFLFQIKTSFYKYFFPALSGIVYFFTGILVIASYYTFIPWANLVFTFGELGGALLIVFSLIRFHLFSPSEKIFDRNFVYKTAVILLIFVAYSINFYLSKTPLTFEVLTLIVTSLILILLSHSFYDWFSTFVNDLIYNASSGLSVVNDEEIAQAVKNLNSPARLEDSPLMRLKIVNHHSSLPVDNLRKTVKEAIEYFKPEATQQDRRLKTTLKYEILRMLAFDQAEEGQILWELGFDEYPVSIMTKETRNRPPRFKVQSPSDYSYVSRNAYLTLKREAIHDIAWRISYLEKLSKKKII